MLKLKRLDMVCNIIEVNRNRLMLLKPDAFYSDLEGFALTSRTKESELIGAVRSSLMQLVNAVLLFWLILLHHDDLLE